jgi:hypothetical protein
MDTNKVTSNTNTVRDSAKNLSKDYLRSPRETLGGYVIAARTLDKCRATLAGTPENTTLTVRSIASFSLLHKSPLTTSRILSLPGLPTKRSLNGLSERRSRGRESRSSNGTMNGAIKGSLIFRSLCPGRLDIALITSLTFMTPRRGGLKPSGA